MLSTNMKQNKQSTRKMSIKPGNHSNQALDIMRSTSDLNENPKIKEKYQKSQQLTQNIKEEINKYYLNQLILLINIVTMTI